jgi:hypothetical protein
MRYLTVLFSSVPSAVGKQGDIANTGSYRQKINEADFV